MHASSSPTGSGCWLCCFLLFAGEAIRDGGAKQMKERSFTVKLRGITPLVMNSNAALIDGGVDKGRDKAAYEREHFRDLCYRQPDGALYIPARAIKKSLIVACKFVTDKPKGMGIKSFGPIIEGALLVDGDALLDKSIEDVVPWTVVVNLDPSKGPKGPRGPRTRPMIPIAWSASTSMTVMDDSLSGDVLAKIAEAAGKRCGVLDARSIDYGRCFIEVKES
jgi:hypothetical protein